MSDGEKEEQREGENAGLRKSVIRKHTDLDVYQRSFAAAMRVFFLSKEFPSEEKFSLTSQCRRSSRSVAANLTEAWRKRKYPAAFVSKLSDAEAEAAETQTWIQFAVECGYVDKETATPLYSEYDKIIGMLVKMATNPAHCSF
jgi:four helix bundle protein